MTLSRPELRLASAALAALLAAGCWDAPVRERLEVELLDDGSARAILVVELDPPSRYEEEGEAALRRRLERKARDLEDGSDPWLARFDLDGCPRQGGGWLRDEGELVEFRRWMHCESAEQAFRVLGSAAVTVEVGRQEREAELVLLPLGGGEASRRDRERARAEIDLWSAQLEEYFQAAWALAERARVHPELSAELWAAGLDLPSSDQGSELGAADARLARALVDASEAAFGVLRPRPGEEETADEVVRRVYDPLPARLAIRLPATATAVEGFEPAGAARYAAPERSLYAAFERLAARWLAPDPLVARVRRGRAGGEGEVAVGPFAAADPRVSAMPPTAAELEEALLAELERRDPLRLAWRFTGADDDREGDPEDDEDPEAGEEEGGRDAGVE